MTTACTLLASGNVVSSGFTTASVSPAGGALQLLVINVTRDGSTNPTAPSSIVGNGLTWTLAATVPYDPAGVGRGAAWVYRAMDPAPTTGTTVVSGIGTNAAGGVIYQWYQFTGVKQTGTNGADALVQTVITAATATDTPSVTLAAFASATNGTFGLCLGRANGPTTAVTPGTGFTELSDIYYAGGGQTLHSAGEFRNDNDTSVDFTYVTNTGLGGQMLVGFEIANNPVQLITATVAPDVGLTAAVTKVTPDAVLGVIPLDIAVSLSVEIIARRPNFRRPRREFLWVTGYDGEQICAIS